jgi:phage terminase small subunit
MHRNIMTPNVAVSGAGAGNTAPLPPAHLAEAGATLWADITRQYRIQDGAGQALLTVAAECLDRMRQAQEAIREHGVLVADRYGGKRQNPACAVERAARHGMITALKALNLDLEPLRDRGDHASPFRRKL